MLFLRGFILKPTERAYVLLKNGTRDFQNSLPFKRSAWFYVTISGSFERCQYFNSETNFLENKKLEHRFLVESTKIENALFLYETVMSEAYVKTNGMVSKNEPITKNGIFASNYFIFLKI